jgi:tetratricopeptide (TPR) repeat protein
MNRSLLLAVLAALVHAAASNVLAQTTPTPRAGRPKSTGPQATSPDPPPPPPRELYQLRSGLYVYPAPYSPDYWSPLIRPYPDYSRNSRVASPRRRRFGPRYRTHGYGRGPWYGGYGYGTPYAYDIEGAYEQGRYDADHEYLWYIASARAGRLLNQHREMFDQALIMFRDGRYDWAAIKLLGAAEKNHANAASRLHAGHALFALGKYDDATHLLARAFELAPSLAHKQYDIRDEYGNKADFERHAESLKSYVSRHPTEPGAVTLLGYITFYTEGPGAAYPYLKRARRLNPKSYFIPKLFKLARVASGMEKTPPSPRKPKSLRQTRGRQECSLGSMPNASMRR